MTAMSGGMDPRDAPPSGSPAGVPLARVARLPHRPRRPMALGDGARGGAAAGAGRRRLAGVAWDRATVLGGFVLADGSAAAAQATTVRIAWDPGALHVRFECADDDAWGTFSRRNDPLYLEEVVEVFLAPGEQAPRCYRELEVSPLGVLFTAGVENPTGRRADLVADTSWECRGLEWQAGPTGASQDWWAELAIPWAELGAGSGQPTPTAPPPRRWRANFYRIERPRGRRPELSCWSPTLTDPPDFHRPERFGLLELADLDPS